MKKNSKKIGNRGQRQRKRSEKRPARQPSVRNASPTAKVIKFKESEILQRWLLTNEGCPDCELAKKDFKREIKNGNVKVVDVGDDIGFKIIKTLNLWEVPSLIFELKDGRYIIEI